MIRKFLKPSRRVSFLKKCKEANDALDKLSPKDVRDISKDVYDKMQSEWNEAARSK